ncbi:hypothetical protein B0H13DRAFT_1915179 [Mycena leptocephala]|nr:hypothetical protein B0H13DRAFT_1915179 [Mycena leptocephala]
MEGVISLEHSLADVLTALAHYEAVLRRSRGLYTSHTPSAHGFPSDLDVTDGGEPQVPDSGDWMAMNFATSPLQTVAVKMLRADPHLLANWPPQETDPSGLCFEAQGINSGMGISSDPRGFPLDTGGPANMGARSVHHGPARPLPPSRLRKTLIYAMFGPIDSSHPKLMGSYHIQHRLPAEEKHTSEVHQNLLITQIHDDGMWYVYTRLGIALEAERNERSKMAEYLREVLGNAQRNETSPRSWVEKLGC